INLVTNSSLDGGYTVFGMVTSNFVVVQNIGKVPTGSGDKPITDVVIDSIRNTTIAALAENNIITGNAEISIYPNPANGIFAIELPNVATQVEIINVRGQVVYCAEEKDVLSVDLRNQPAG